MHSLFLALYASSKYNRQHITYNPEQKGRTDHMWQRFACVNTTKLNKVTLVKNELLLK